MTRRDHLDHRLPPEVRADLLAREMTVVEKCYQLTAVPPRWLARVDLEVGQSRRVRFRVAATQLGYTNLVRDFTVEPARVEVYLGLDSHDRQLESAFELTGAPRSLASAERSFFSEVEVADV